LYPSCPVTEGIRESLLLAAQLAEANELGDVFHSMNDVDEFAVGTQYRRVHRTPEAFFETTHFRRGAPDIVFLDRHRIGNAVLKNAIERSAQVPYSVGVRIVRIVRKHIENATPQDLLTRCHRGLKVRVADRHDREVGGQNEI